MKDYVGENQRILNEWCAKFVEDKKEDPTYDGYNPADYFAPDGIMNKGEFYENIDNECRRKPSGKENQMWAEAPLRILFLSKDQNAYGGEAKDVKTETFYMRENGVPPQNNRFSSSIFYRNEARILYGLLHTNLQEGMVDIDAFSLNDALIFSNEQIFARINCKKEIGGERCDNTLLQNAIDSYPEFLKEQIINLDADILVCCGSGDNGNIILNFLNGHGYNFEYINDETYSIYYDREKNKIAIDSYHLAARVSKDEMYYNSVRPFFNFIKYYPDFIESHRK
jgi:hypothetical protein